MAVVAAGVVGTVGALLSEVSGTEPSWTEQRGEREGDQPQGERHGAAEEGESGEKEPTEEKHGVLKLKLSLSLGFAVIL